MSVIPPKLNELIKLVEAEDAERERRIREADEAQEARKAAYIAAARAVVEEVLGPCRITATDWGNDAVLMVKPVVWQGLVWFQMWQSNGNDGPWRCITGNGSIYADWNEPVVARFLVELQHGFEQKRAAILGDRRARLLDARTEADVAETLEALAHYAPERQAEWVELADAARARVAARAAAVDGYVAALAAWRADYEAALTANRQELDEIRRFADQEFYRYEVAYVAVGDDEEEDSESRYVETAWAADPGPDEKGYWALYVDGRVVRRKLMRVLWVGELVIETVAEAGRGPWRHTVYAPNAGESVACLARVADDIRRAVNGRMRSLPVEPSPQAFGLGGSEWEAEERQRINAVTAGMARADIPF